MTVLMVLKPQAHAAMAAMATHNGHPGYLALTVIMADTVDLPLVSLGESVV